MFNLLDMIIVRPIVNILFLIYSVVGDFGLAIILFTIIVKLITWPLIKRQMHQTKMMRKIQPELAEIADIANDEMEIRGMKGNSIGWRLRRRGIRRAKDLISRYYDRVDID